MTITMNGTEYDKKVAILREQFGQGLMDLACAFAEENLSSLEGAAANELESEWSGRFDEELARMSDEEIDHVDVEAMRRRIIDTTELRFEIAKVE